MPSIKWMVVWSNGAPTQLLQDGVTILTNPFDVIAVDNHKVYHRSPHQEENRWFVRIPNPQCDHILKSVCAQI